MPPRLGGEAGARLPAAAASFWGLLATAWPGLLPRVLSATCQHLQWVGPTFLGGSTLMALPQDL